jgi:hypothetical protein
MRHYSERAPAHQAPARTSHGRERRAGVPVHICVFCASSDAVPDVYRRAAADLGRLLGERGHTLVYGGSNIGLMGVLAEAARGGPGPAWWGLSLGVCWRRASPRNRWRAGGDGDHGTTQRGHGGAL